MILEMEEDVISSAADGEIIGIQFGLASHHEIITSSMSDCPISHASQLANPFLGLPLENGKCESCGTAEPGKCEGHFGYIELPIPVYHPSHVSELKRMLGSICLKCLKMKTNKVPVKNNGVMERLLSACCEEACHVSVKENKSNDGASFLELKIPGRSRVDGAWNFLERFGYRYGDGSSRTLLASEVLAMLKKLREETKRKLAKKGYFPQDGYILRYLPVPPNCLSVPDVSDGVSVMSSDLCSSMLKKVLRQIEIIRSSRSGEPNFEAHEVEANDLQIAVSQYLEVRGTSKAARGDNRYGVSKEGSSSSTKSWLEKMRTLFISKGSGFSSRSVITGDAFRPVNEVGIPSEIAQKMTFEERVNVHNIQFLQRLVDKNLCLTFRDGSSTYSLREGSKGHTFLRIGQVVHRRIMDGDIVFINRPPTTHKHSLQALRVYIHEDHVVKINPLMCGPLAADFDGDCVHLFYPQSLSARAEVLELFSVDKQLLSSHSGNLNLQLAIDALLSLKTIFKSYFLDKASAQQLAMHASSPLPSPAVCKAGSSGPRWSAQQVLQTALPPKFECHGERLLIRGSEVVKLDFNRDVIASVVSDILTSLFFSKSPKEALNFFDSLQPLLMENLFAEGFSVSLHDFFLPFSELEDMQSQIQDISPLLFQLRSSFNQLIQLQFESYMKLLKVPVANFILKSSALGGLIDSRSESAIDKIVQQIGFLGLQLSDKRKFYSRSLVEEVASLFKTKHPFASLYPSEEFGLVKSCFFRGLDPYEGMVHSIATREVIVRSSKGLAEPGTLFKNLMAVLRDVVICYDGSVRNVSSNSVIQFEYGLGGVSSENLFPAGEPVGVLAATAMSNPAYKAVLDSSPSSNSSWDMMKEILFCRANFRNDLNDRRVILYLNDCACGRKYCQENASFVVKNHLQKVSLRDAAVEFLIEYKRPKAEPGSTEVESGLVGHVHLNATLLRESRISMQDILKKCEEQLNLLRKKKKYGQFFKRLSLYVSDFCLFPNSGRMCTGMPCLKFFWDDIAEPHLEKLSHLMVDVICPFLFDTVIKGDPRISTVNIVWINPGTTSWVESPCSNRKGELGVEVTLEKTAVRQDGDAWRVVLDCCLPVFHLIDTRRSIPYAIKQIQDLLGISCGFDQAVQRLSTSVTSVTKGVLKEHLILLASSMTCSGNLVGFNMSGIKAICRALSAQVPFTEATLYTPRKCFERASEKCHVDSLSGIVASCSWGKRVAVGTGTKFDILWDTKEIEMDEKPIDVYNFLHLVRSSNDEEMDTGCLGEDVEKFDWEHMEPVLSPDQENSAVFEDMVELGLDSLDQGGGDSGWDALPSSGTASAGGDGWANWGQKKEQAHAEDSSKSGNGWGTSSASAEGNWGLKKDPVQPEDKSSSGGWDAQKSQDSEKDQGWNAGSGSGLAEGNGWANWGSKKAQAQPEDSRKAVGWGASRTQDSGKEEGKTQSWDNGHSSGQEKATWGSPDAASWKQNSLNGDANPLKSSDVWGSKKSASSSSQGWNTQEKKQSWNSAGNDGGVNSSLESPSGASWNKNSNGHGGGSTSTQVNPHAGTGSWGSGKKESNTQSSWAQQKGSSWKNNHEKKDENQAGPGTWGSKKDDNQAQSTWEQKQNSSGGAGGWNSDRGHKETGLGSSESQNDERKSQPAWGQSNTSTWNNSAKSANEWGSDKSSQPAISTGWGSEKATVASAANDSVGGGSGGWESNIGERKTQSSWGQRNESTGKNALRSDNLPSPAEKNIEVGASKSWDSRKEENSTQSKWGQPKDAEQTCAWNSNKSDKSGGSFDKWPSQAGKDTEVGGSNSWQSRKGEKSTQSAWGQPTVATTKNNEQTDAWDSKKLDKPRASSSWGSGKGESGGSDKVLVEGNSQAWGKSEERKTQSSWGQPSESTGKSSPSADGWGSNKSVQPDSLSGWGSGKADSGSSDKAHEEDSSGAWGSKTDDKKSQSSWGQRSETTWKSSSSADGWGSNKLNQHGNSPGRGSGRSDNGGRGSGKSDNGGRGWGSSNSGEWKSRKNRPPRQPGSTDDTTPVALTATRKRMDLFPADEQDALSEVETIMQSIRRIMHQSGCNDGDPLPSDDQSYIISNVLEYHPDKTAKMGVGVDFITVKKHGNFQESRCFFVVATDGQAEDFSYIKCLENFIKGKYPSIAESFNSKYFRKPRQGGNRQQGQHNSTQNSPGSPNFTQNAPDSPNFTPNTPESPNFTQSAPDS